MPASSQPYLPEHGKYVVERLGRLREARHGASPPSRNRAAALPPPTRTGAEPTLRVMLGKLHPSASATLSALPSARPQNDKVNAMIHPSEPELRRPLAGRGGQGAPVTCAACGCRLAATGDAWFHFNPLGGRDAREIGRAHV